MSVPNRVISRSGESRTTASSPSSNSYRRQTSIPALRLDSSSTRFESISMPGSTCSSSTLIRRLRATRSAYMPLLSRIEFLNRTNWMLQRIAALSPTNADRRCGPISNHSRSETLGPRCLCFYNQASMSPWLWRKHMPQHFARCRDTFGHSWHCQRRNYKFPCPRLLHHGRNSPPSMCRIVPVM